VQPSGSRLWRFAYRFGGKQKLLALGAYPAVPLADDYHTWSLLRGIALSTLLGVGSQVSFGTQQTNLVQAIRESTQESTNQAGQRIVQKELNIQPTITIRPGWALRVVVHKDLILRPYRLSRGDVP